MKKYIKKIAIAIIILLTLILTTVSVFNYNKSPVSTVSKQVEIDVPKGATYLSISRLLKTNNLIRDRNFYNLYIKIYKPKKLESGKYILNANMSLDEIIDTLSKGSKINPNEIKLTFNEGITIPKYATIIENGTNNSKSDLYDLLSDKEYLKELINHYWFLDESILNDKLYYSLEGYLEPNTYFFKNKDVTVKEIVKKLLDARLKSLDKIKDKINQSKYNVHEIITLASIVEAEAKGKEDRKMVAQVFYNRINKNMNFGSDVTTYYGIKIDMSERDLKQTEINACNNYNTRSNCLIGSLPIGPINNPSDESIRAALEPTKHDYLFFVSDKFGKMYYRKTNAEHEAIIKTLKEEGKWFIY